MSLSENNSGEPKSEFQENLDILRQINLFAQLPLEALKVLAYLCTRERFREDDYLFRQGDDDGQAYYILAGTAQLERTDENGELTIRNLEADQFIGGMSIAGGIRRLYSLKAQSQLDCLVLTRKKFTRTMEQYPQLMPKVLTAIVKGVIEWEERLLGSATDFNPNILAKLGVSLL
jgi:CRP-like cAMP-binding protein